MTTTYDEAKARGQAKFLQHLYSVIDGVAIRCALELRVADIINNHDGPITLSQIADGISSPSLNIDGLSRLIRFLVHKKIIDEEHTPQCSETLYSLNSCSKWLLCDPKTTLIPLARMVTDSFMLLPLYNLHKSVTEGGTVYEKTYGHDFWDSASLNPNMSRIFNEGMACSTRFTMDAIMSHYNFGGLKGTLVDVGGGLGVAINEIVTTYPHLKGINFDLPHVIATAPIYNGVTHVGGDIFKAIPPADSIFIKWIMHDWSDDECVEILKNCRKAISTQAGKIIIVEIVLHPGRDDVFDDTRIAYDVLMFGILKGGRERTEAEFKKILEEAGFRRYNFIKIPALESIIEVYLD